MCTRHLDVEHVSSRFSRRLHCRRNFEPTTLVPWSTCPPRGRRPRARTSRRPRCSRRRRRASRRAPRRRGSTARRRRRRRQRRRRPASARATPTARRRRSPPTTTMTTTTTTTTAPPTGARVADGRRARARTTAARQRRDEGDLSCESRRRSSRCCDGNFRTKAPKQTNAAERGTASLRFASLQRDDRSIESPPTSSVSQAYGNSPAAAPP